MLSTEHAGFAVNGVRLLQPISLAFSEGEVVGLIGANGAGKSTLLKVLARQLRPSEGEVRLEGRPLAHWSRRSFARRVAYLAQDVPSTDDLSVGELVRFGRYPWRGPLGRMTARDDERVHQAMELTHVHALRHRAIETLSGGERQRAWLAMLLAQESRYLLLDEPLSALDVAHQTDVMRVIRRLGCDLKLVVVVVMHDINIASRYCDRLVALRDGALLANGRPEQVIDEQGLAAIYGIPMQVLSHPAHRYPIAVAR